MMNPEIKKRWLEALRSGEYQQGVARLRRRTPGQPETEDRYCCLGVLCELYAKDTGAEWVFDECGKIDGSATGLGPNVVEWAGLNKNMNELVYGPNKFSGGNVFLYRKIETGKKDSHGVPIVANSLMGLNDKGATFLQIADAIESDL